MQIKRDKGLGVGVPEEADERKTPRHRLLCVRVLLSAMQGRPPCQPRSIAVRATGGEGFWEQLEKVEKLFLS